MPHSAPIRLVATELVEFGEVLAGVLQRDNPTGLAQPLDVYARAVGAYPALRVAVGAALSINLQALCQAAIEQAARYTTEDLLLGVTTAAEALNRLLAVVDVDSAVLTAAVDLFPVDADQILGPLALTLTDKFTEHFRELAASNAAVYAPELASALNKLSVRLTEAGRREEGLTAIQDAVTIRRRLATANPAAYEADLAKSLNNLSVVLAGAGRREEGLTAIQDAVTIRRRLATASEANLASSLNNLSIRLADAGRREEGLTAIQDAVTIRRRLATANPAAYEADLASSLNNLSNRLADAGRREEGLTAIQDAVTIRRRLATANPAAYEADLAMSLNNLSIRLADAGRRDESARVSREATELGRHG